MFYLIIVSFIWAFSFGLIKKYLVDFNPNLITFIRLLLSFLFFLPFLRIKNISLKIFFQLLLIGSIQYGLMYTSYIFSYQFLQSYEIALLTIFTPIWVYLISDIFQLKINFKSLSAVIIATIGGGIILFKKEPDLNNCLGFILVQISNVSFAFGQVYYKKISLKYYTKNINHLNVFAILYLGATLFSIISLIYFYIFHDKTIININYISPAQIMVLFYLGIIASGLCFFWWNLGATKISNAKLAIFNNLKIPLAVIISILIFQEKGNLISLAIGGSLILLASLVAK